MACNKRGDPIRVIGVCSQGATVNVRSLREVHTTTVRALTKCAHCIVFPSRQCRMSVALTCESEEKGVMRAENECQPDRPIKTAPLRLLDESDVPGSVGHRSATARRGSSNGVAGTPTHSRFHQHLKCTCVAIVQVVRERQRAPSVHLDHGEPTKMRPESHQSRRSPAMLCRICFRVMAKARQFDDAWSPFWFFRLVQWTRVGKWLSRSSRQIISGESAFNLIVSSSS